MTAPHKIEPTDIWRAANMTIELYAEDANLRAPVRAQMFYGHPTYYLRSAKEAADVATQVIQGASYLARVVNGDWKG